MPREQKRVSPTETRFVGEEEEVGAEVEVEVAVQEEEEAMLPDLQEKRPRRMPGRTKSLTKDRERTITAGMLGLKRCPVEDFQVDGSYRNQPPILDLFVSLDVNSGNWALLFLAGNCADGTDCSSSRINMDVYGLLASDGPGVIAPS